MNINQSVAKKVLDTVDAGLVKGMGSPVPGQMCVEAAVCYAMGLAHSDNPPCVGKAVRSFKIQLNDSCWSTNAVRAAGMRKLAIAQLGSNEIDQVEFAKKLSEQTIRVLIPKLFRKVAPSLPEKHQRAILGAADRCEQEGTADAARAAVDVAVDAADRVAGVAGVARAVADTVAAVARAADCAAAAAARAAAAAAVRAAGVAVADADRVAGVAAGAAALATDCAAAAVADAGAANEFLNLSADIALNILIEMKSPGCEFLHLCD